jgi:phosphoglycerate kinase
MKKLTIKDVDLKGKRLLMRVDFNVPLDENQKVTDDKRIRASIPTIQYAIDHGASVILMSHLGRPKGQVIPEMSLKPVALLLGEILGKEVRLAEDCVGENVERRVTNLQEGDVLLLENVRFHGEETENDPEFSLKLSRLGDIYANDAFGSAHRAHCSTVGVAKLFKIAVAGFLMEKELSFLGSTLTNPDRPFVALLGGVKIIDKIPVIENLLDKTDSILIGGGMACTFFKAQGKETGRSIVDETSLDFVRSILRDSPEKILLPLDCVISDRFDFKARQIGEIQLVSVDEIPPEWTVLDIGPETIEAFSDVCNKAGTVVWNGPMGVFEMEDTAGGTLAMARCLAEVTQKGTTTIIGGGDSASAVKMAGVADKMSHVSTGGGASLEFLQGKELPGVTVLTDAEEIS